MVSNVSYVMGVEKIESNEENKHYTYLYRYLKIIISKIIIKNEHVANCCFLVKIVEIAGNIIFYA